MMSVRLEPMRSTTNPQRMPPRIAAVMADMSTSCAFCCPSSFVSPVAMATFTV